jgi:hypothetical protein
MTRARSQGIGQNSKSIFAAVLKKAEEARILLSGRSTRTSGMRRFDSLVREHPRDGMIYFKRAEAHEALNDLRAAAADYREAEGLFPRPLWRDLARSRAERLERDSQAAELRMTVSSALGGRATRELSHIADSAWHAGRFANEIPFVSIELSRTALVRAIKVLEDARASHKNRGRSHAGPSLPVPPWAQRLDAVSEAVSEDVVRRAKSIFAQRNEAVYDGAHVISGQAQAAFETLIEFLRATFRPLV